MDESIGMNAALKGKVVCVTGAGNGIGRAVAERLALEGSAVVVADLGTKVEGDGAASAAPAQAVTDVIHARGGQATAVWEDVSTKSGADAIVTAAIDAFGRIDGMVCCAGNLSHARVHELTSEAWNAMIGVHLTGQFHCTAAAARAMLASETAGRIVHFASAAALRAAPASPHYAAAKAGVMAFSRSCARALAPAGITVNCVLPGASTRMTDKIWEGSRHRAADTTGLSLTSQ